MRILTFTTLYPSAARPNFGVFVENRLRHLVATGAVESRVVAPVPWFPLRHRCFGEYGRFAATPRAETRHGLDVLHPRYALLPKAGMTMAPFSLFASGLRVLRTLIRTGYDFDLIDAHYFYPDGVAAVWLGRALRKPVVVTARGTDINLIPRYRRTRAMIIRAGQGAAAMVAVCQALKDEMVALGMDGARIRVLRNGVDLTLFTPHARDAARARFGITRPALVAVGGLIERKAHDIAVRAMALLPDMELLIAGEGEQRRPLEKLIGDLGLSGRVRLLGAVPHADLAALYSAADISLLTSSREGWANVLLEAMACGTPVVA
ncbi:MAG: glycosyltransferase family 4 protein, partial [Alphaproteobacteria bacterium]